MKMKAEDKTMWLAALRSGEYQQAQGALQDGEGYCCLGVLQCVLDGKVETVDGIVGLPIPTDEWLENHGIFKSVYGHTHNMISFAEANDAGMPFDEIADEIERYVEIY